MPIVSLHRGDPLVDGRQSERAMLVRRGVQRLMGAMRISLLPEMALDSGRRADLAGLTEKGDVVIVEIKSSIEDFRVDRKWPIYRLHCDRLYFATHPGVPLDIFPEDCGLILSDGYGAEILREAPEHRLAGSTRKVMTLRFARAAADRLQAAEWAANPYLTGPPPEAG
ncbi:MmcB family DNA repair protein [Aureimonas leprariae]|uniref:MmcB family DNA repair protein n=1 Tax=Plantimonas leprariae TaxID=2615207 RepID=A0A7V7PTM6_9HYPH|nr:MmcB family DNA repair protein [Aureimonas leprariae]KAB0682919.1 MmcB family DNA repair protein [Aureimonas leprariae]